MDSEKNTRGIRVPVGAEAIALMENHVIAITWSEIGDLSSFRRQENPQKSPMC